jgi:hypothetical protein
MEKAGFCHFHDQIRLFAATNFSWGRQEMPPLLMAKRHAGAELEEQDQPPRVCLQPSPELRDGAVLGPGDFKGPRGRAWAAVVLSVVATARSQCKEGDMVNPFVNVPSAHG